MTEKLEVYQDMAIHGPIAKRPELREALITAAVDPWRVDLERSAEVASNAVTSEDVVLFRRDAGQDHPAAGLTLWGTEDGYYVPNIVPLETGSLTFAQYNAVLTDFGHPIGCFDETLCNLNQCPIGIDFSVRTRIGASGQTPKLFGTVCVARSGPGDGKRFRRFRKACGPRRLEVQFQIARPHETEHVFPLQRPLPDLLGE